MKAGKTVLRLLAAALAVCVGLSVFAQDAQRPATASSPEKTIASSVPISDPHVPFNPYERSKTFRQYPSRLAPPSILPMRPALAKPAGIDLDVTCIGRTPMYSRYSVWYTEDGRPYLEPGTEGGRRWPDPGELVAFTAHIVNKGTVASGGFAFKWFVDGGEVASGNLASLAPDEETTTTYQWVWAHTLDGERLLGTHTIRFDADPANLISETYESNNSIEDRTDAMGLAMALSPASYAAYEVPLNSMWSFSAEDWLQRQIAAMNATFARSVYSSLPVGVTERVRIDTIFVSADMPEIDPSEDGAWYIPDDVRHGAYYDAVTDVDGGLLHELAHQLGVIDIYNLDVPLETPQVLDRLGQPIQVEYSAGYLFPGLMVNPGVRPPFFDEHSALALERNKGYRRGYFGEYLYDVPDQVVVRVLDDEGSPAEGVTVDLYQRSPGPIQNGSLGGTIDNAPEITATTGPDGKASLANRSVGTPVSTQTGHLLRDNPLGPIDVVGFNDQFLVVLTKDSHQECAWLDVTAFNLAAWHGEASTATLDVASHVPPSDAPDAPDSLDGIQEFGLVKLQWPASSSDGVTGYNIYRTDRTVSPYRRIVAGIASLSYTETYDQTKRAAIYVVSAVDGAGRESGFSNPFYAFSVTGPVDVVVDGEDNRIVLDPKNGYALLRQRPDGAFFDTLGSQHFHLELSRFVFGDSAERLVLSGANSALSIHSVSLADPGAMPLFVFGGQGAGAGQFQTPSGVAAVGAPLSVEGPHGVDAHTMLLLHFDGDYSGAQGETGTTSGTSFVAGRYAQAVKTDATDTLTYPVAGNIDPAQGAVEFWVRPDWKGANDLSHVFFEAGSGEFNRMRIAHDGWEGLRFTVWDGEQEYEVVYDAASWLAGDWHHVATTWEGSEIALYVDGARKASSNTVNLPANLGDTIYVGSSRQGDQQANATIDELRVSDNRRVGDSETCQYRFLVADSGNNRIQAFNWDGLYIDTYGQFGTAPGEFHYPTGMDLAADGCLLVTDTGNNRIEVLTFDGAHFGFVRVIEAGLNYPVGIAAFGRSRIVVADTGNNRIKVLDRQGVLLGEYAAPNDGRTGGFYAPRGVAVDGQGNIVVADTGNKRVVTIRDALTSAGAADWQILGD